MTMASSAATTPPGVAAKVAFASTIVMIGVAMVWRFLGVQIGPLAGPLRQPGIDKILFDQHDGPSRVMCGVLKEDGGKFCSLTLTAKGPPHRLDTSITFATPASHVDLVVTSTVAGKADVQFLSPDLKFGGVTVRLNPLMFAWVSQAATAAGANQHRNAGPDIGQIEGAWQKLECAEWQNALTLSGLFGNPVHRTCRMSGSYRTTLLGDLEHIDNVALAINSIISQTLLVLDGASFRRAEEVFLHECAARLPHSG